MSTFRFLGQALAKLNVRPRRLAYLVRAGNREDFVKAVRYATTEWGGQGHPIVPVSADGRIAPLWFQVCELLEPEVFIDYAGIGERLRGRLQERLSASTVDESSFHYQEPGIHCMVSIAPQSLRGLTVRTCLPVPSLLQQVALGVIPDDQIDLWRETGAAYVPAEQAIDLIDAQVDGASPIGLTVRQFPAYQASNSFGDHVIVFCEERIGLRGATYFWNMRACTVPSMGLTAVLFMSPEMLRTPQARARLQELCLRKTMSRPDLFLVGSKPDMLRRLASRAGFVELKSKKISRAIYGPKRRDLAEEPLSYMVNVHPGSLLFGKRLGGRRANVSLAVTQPSMTVQCPSPVQFNHRVSGYLRVDIQEVPQLDWPKRASVARLIHDHAEFTSHGLSLVSSPSGVYRFDLRVPSAPEVCNAALQEKGWAWSLSDKGRYAQALVPEPNGMARVAPLASRFALDVVKTLASLSGRKAQQLLARVGKALSAPERELLLSRVAAIAGSRWLTANEIASELSTRKARVLSLLAELTSHELVRRGFRFDCPVCGLRTVLVLAEVEDLVSCPGCGQRTAVLGPREEEPLMVYSLNSLLDRAVDQDCVGHLIAMDSVMRTNEGAWMVPGADLRSASGQREVDLLGVSAADLIVGEVKPAQAFTNRTIRDVVALAGALSASVLVLASLDAWTDSRKKMALTAAATAGIRLHVLDAYTLLGGG